MAKRLALTDKTRCVACGACTVVCPKQAISVQKGCYAIVDAEICIGCGKCSVVCPAGCIDIKERVQNEA